MHFPKYFCKFLKKCSIKNVQENCKKSTKNLQKIYKKFAKNLQIICKKSTKNFQKIYKKFAKILQKSCDHPKTRRWCPNNPS